MILDYSLQQPHPISLHKTKSTPPTLLYENSAASSGNSDYSIPPLSSAIDTTATTVAASPTTILSKNECDKNYEQDLQEQIASLTITDSANEEEMLSNTNTTSSSSCLSKSLVTTTASSSSTTTTTTTTTTTEKNNNYAAAASFHHLFSDSTFTPQSIDRHLFRNSSFSIPQEYHHHQQQHNQSYTNNAAGHQNPFMRQYNNQQLLRRESTPNLGATYTLSAAPDSLYQPQQHRSSVGDIHNMDMYASSKESIFSNTTAINGASSSSSYYNTYPYPHQQPQPPPALRKFSVDLLTSTTNPTNKRLDLVDNKKMLSASYSNPDLGSTARRMGGGSLDAGVINRRCNNYLSTAAAIDELLAIQQQQQQQQNSPASSVAANVALFNSTSSPVTPVGMPTHPYFYHPQQMQSSSSLLASHLFMRHNSLGSPSLTNANSSSSKPPSPINSRKNSLQMHPYPHHQQQHLNGVSAASNSNNISRRASSNTLSTSTAANNNGNGPMALVMEDRFAMVQLEDVMDDIYALCKDQYGCRFFQKKLEEKQKPEHRDIIFTQIYPHFVELMTDPFGNYLCQKMMEYCTDIQRTSIVEQVAKAIIPISLNMHGTRAVQRMIEFLTLPEQINKTIEALAPNVVTLIKDINGNHVIQKCLHKLSHHDKQFIYDSVSRYCIEVATHRHGCCVLQRCIDYSADHQKKQLVDVIIQHALTLVQDPYGNYVVQYVLELGDAQFSDQLIRQFLHHIAELSVQKYSSNVIEKCIRVAEEDTRRQLIDEIMMDKTRLEKLLKDSYANYVVQTALDFADDGQYQKLADCIRPLLPLIRNTAYCKRIQSKLQNRDQTSKVNTHHRHHHHPHQQQPSVTATSNGSSLHSMQSSQHSLLLQQQHHQHVLPSSLAMMSSANSNNAINMTLNNYMLAAAAAAAAAGNTKHQHLHSVYTGAILGGGAVANVNTGSAGLMCSATYSPQPTPINAATTTGIPTNAVHPLISPNEFGFVSATATAAAAAAADSQFMMPQQQQQQQQQQYHFSPFF